MIRIDFTFGSETVRVSDVDHRDSSHNFYKGCIDNPPSISNQLTSAQYGLRTPYGVTIELADNKDTNDLTWATRVMVKDIRGGIVKFYRSDDDGKVFTAAGTVTGWGGRDTFKVFVSLFDDELFERTFSETITTDVFTDTALDVGAPINRVFGNGKDVPLYNIQNNYDDDEYDYLVGFGTLEDVWEDAANGRGIHRGDKIVSPSTYTFYDGSQGSPYPGFAFIRFTTEQRDFSGNMWALTGDFKGLEMGGSVAERNPVNVIYNFLINTVWGLGGSANAASFAAAAAIIGTDYYCDGAITSARQANDVLSDLSKICRGSLTKNESGEYIISIEGTGSSVGTFGSNDGHYNNVETIDVSGIQTSEYIRSVTVKYGSITGQRYVMELFKEVGFVGIATDQAEMNFATDEAEENYATYFDDTVTDYGVDVVEELPFVEDYNTALRRLSYLVNKARYTRFKIQSKFSLEGKNLSEGSVIRYIDPRRNLLGLYIIRSWTRDGRTKYSGVLENYESEIYDLLSYVEPTAVDEPSDTTDSPTSIEDDVIDTDNIIDDAVTQHESATTSTDVDGNGSSIDLQTINIVLAKPGTVQAKATIVNNIHTDQYLAGIVIDGTAVCTTNRAGAAVAPPADGVFTDTLVGEKYISTAKTVEVKLQWYADSATSEVRFSVLDVWAGKK